MPVVPEKARLELGWPRLLSALAAEARTPIGRERSFELPFLDDRDAVALHLTRVAEARRLLRESLEIPLADAPDARTHVNRAAREGVLESSALLDCARLIRTAARVRRFLRTRAELAPVLASESAALSEFDPLAAEIERAIEPSGTLSDQASPLLAELRDRTRGLHRTLKTRIDDILRNPDYEEVLRDNYSSIRDDRYVVPVKTSHKARLPGIVHNASQSGQTLFVEPEQLIELGNQLTIAQSMALEEERRILRDLSDAVGRRATELLADSERLAELDRVNAAARLADKLQASEPELAGGRAPFRFLGLRHPLLVLRGVPVVANDVRLEDGRQGIIVSGPNAGGKTVTLTAVGLSALMVRAGLPVAAEAGSSVPLYQAVYTAIGDEGDLSRDLSTFTAHLTALRDIARDTIPGTLVCIDEIAADTDPREGAAIATAMLEQLADKGAHVLITTHLDEVKAKGLTDPRFMSASVGFDFEKLAPTYRLRLNEVGASSALEIARRVGLPEAVCERARELLGGSGGALDRAITALQRDRAELRRLTAVLEEEKKALVRAREEWDRQRLALQQKEREASVSVRREVLAEIEAARATIRRTLSELQGAPLVKTAVEAQRMLDQAGVRQEEEIARATTQLDVAASGEAWEGAIAPGTRVRVASIGREGEVLDVDEDSATVAVGALKARVPLTDVVAMTGRTKQAASFKRSREEKAQAIERVKPASVPSGVRSIDLRGLRTEDALRDLRATLDGLFREDARELTIVHGHGTGALKKAVREELGSSPYAASFRPGEPQEGGDGVTLVTLKGR